jgi:hypothetical protein
MKSDLKQNLLTEANAFVHSQFEDFIIDNKLNFSLVRSPELKTAINDYKENDTAQIFDVFLRGLGLLLNFN